MALDPDKLQKPLHKLRKSLKRLSRRPTPSEVHDLRTRSRRLEAILHALPTRGAREGERLLDAVAPIRKRAGRVRDMDVLTGFALTLTQPLANSGERECLVQLLEHLGAKRFRLARKLANTAAKQRREARRSLKRYSSAIERAGKSSRKRASEHQWRAADATAIALQLSRELADWPPFNRKNLHSYRLKVKELRYMLQLAEDEDTKFIEVLGEVTDAIGEWHDWNQLAEIAGKMLGAGKGHELLGQIRSTAKSKFDRALSLATEMRDNDLGAVKNHDAMRDADGRQKPAAIAASKLAA